ncbi:MAG: hypothetical protein JNK45_27420, partial [Myxococcales bacterium]|nr:hypothetical protein [Myxococcales bacterium]
DLAPGELLPLLVFLPGIGEYDDVSSCPGNVDVCAASDCGNDGLCRNLSWGPQQLMRLNNWDDQTRPFVMVSPQNDVPPFSNIEWSMTELDDFFDFIVENYPVDPRRLYLTGMSQGGRGVFQYVAHAPRRFAAASPLPGGQVQAGVTCGFQDTALWIFHGENDNNANLGVGVFSPCTVVEYASIYANPAGYPQYPECVSYLGQPRPAGRITMFDNVGHSAWVPAIDPIGQGFPASEWPSDQGCGSMGLTFRDYSAASDADGIYTWMLSLDRPDVSAGDDVEVPGDGAPVLLTATTIDDDAITYTWTQTSGPAATLVDADSATLTVDDLAPETVYTFEVFAVDADNQWDRDEVLVSVLEAPLGSESSSSGGSDGGGTSGGISGGISAGGSESTGAGSDGGVGSSDGGVGSSDGGVGSSDGGVGSSDGGSESSGAVGSSEGGSSEGGTTGVGTSEGGTSEGGSSEGGSSEGGSSEGGSSGVGTSEGGSTGGDSTASTSGSGSASADSSGGASSGESASVGDSSASTSATGGSASATDTDASASGSATVGETEGGSSTTEPPFAGEDNPGCGCTTEGTGDRGVPWMFGAAVFALRRRRRARSSSTLACTRRTQG